MSISTRDKIGTETLAAIGEANYFNQWMYETISSSLKGHVLEIGSGIGNISQFIISDGHEITLSDFDKDYCNYLNKRFGSGENPRDILSIDLQHPEFFEFYQNLQEKFDTVILLNVIEHLKDDASAIKNCKYLLRQRGTLVVLAPSYSWLFCELDKQLGHYRRYNKTSLSCLLEQQGFLVQEKKYFNFLGIAGWAVYGKLLKNKIITRTKMFWYNRLVNVAKYLDKILMNRIGLSTIVTAIKQ